MDTFVHTHITHRKDIKMSTKTPYELRFDILSLANDYFEKVTEANTQFAIEAYKAAVALNATSVDDWKSFVPTPQYTLEDVLKKAEELYSFVSGSAATKGKK
jgi:hypothetical protein